METVYLEQSCLAGSIEYLAGNLNWTKPTVLNHIEQHLTTTQRFPRPDPAIFEHRFLVGAKVDETAGRKGCTGEMNGPNDKGALAEFASGENKGVTRGTRLVNLQLLCKPKG